MRKTTSMLLCFVLIFSSIFQMNSLPSQAAFNDYANHWAKSYIEDAMKLGFVKGYPDGSVKPDASITRAEFFSMINNAFLFNETSAIRFTDVKIQDWFYPSIQRAVHAGYASGYLDGSMRPDHNISRQEAAVVFHKITGIENIAQKAMFTDASTIQDWGLKAIISVFESKIMRGYPDGSFKPEAPLTRAEAMVTILNAIKKKTVVYDKLGTYGPENSHETIAGSVVVSADDVILQNMTINGDLIISEALADGDVTLNNITVNGTTYIRGGGANSIHISGGAYGRVVIENLSSDRLRIIVKNVENFEIILSQGTERKTIILEGDFKKVSINTNHSTLQTQGTTHIDQLIIESNLIGTTIDLGPSTSVRQLTVLSEAKITGLGQIVQANVYAYNVFFDQEPDSLFVAPGITDPEVIPVVLPSGGGASPSGSSSSGGSSGGSGTVNPPVAEATVPGQPSDVKGTLADGQSLISFLPPANNGGSPIIQYRIQVYLNGSLQSELSETGVTSPIWVDGLTNGMSYTFTATAVNNVGSGLESLPSAPVIPGTVPSAPTFVTGSAGDSHAVISFSAPVDNGGRIITKYVVKVYQNGTEQTAMSESGIANRIIVDGLTNGMTYTFTVTAQNELGFGQESSPSDEVTPVPGSVLEARALLSDHISEKAKEITPNGAFTYIYDPDSNNLTVNILSLASGIASGDTGIMEIGRASCRERV